MGNGKVTGAAGAPPGGGRRWVGLLLLVPGVLYDFVFLSLQRVLRYLIPLAFLAIFLFLLFMVWLDMDQDTSTTSNTATVMLVTLSALGFTWASAIDRADPDYRPLMVLSKQLMHAALLLILATGFKFVLRNIPGIGFLPMDGKMLRSLLWLIMAGFFTQAMLEAGMPLLKLYNLIVGKGAYLPGDALMKRHLPKFHDRFAGWLRRHGSRRLPETSGGTPGGAPI